MMSIEQVEFARKHGITLCPPSPEFGVYWGPRSGKIGIGWDESEAQILARMSSYDPMSFVEKDRLPYELRRRPDG